MEEILGFLSNLLSETIMTVITSLIHNWLPLTLAVLTAALMKVYVDAEKLKRVLLKRPTVSIVGSVAFGAFTPLCACGTMSVVIGMLTTTLPWGPVMAFLTSSPLMSPDAFILITGILSLNFAVALTIASLVLGLGSGYLTHVIERKSDFLKNQTRFKEKPKPQACCSGSAAAPEESCGCSSPAVAAASACACSGPEPVKALVCCSEAALAVEQASLVMPGTVNTLGRILTAVKWREIFGALYEIGLKQILLNFSIFIGVGYLINSFVPTSLIMALFSSKSIFAVPLAALTGLPLYVSGDAAIPLIKSLMTGGASGGAMLAFMITGSATSAWVIAGIAAFMKKRIIGLYVGCILVGGILCGYLYELYLAIAR